MFEKMAGVGGLVCFSTETVDNYVSNYEISALNAGNYKGVKLLIKK
ncbi:hypothetical protein [Thiomicrorhabdus sp. 6S3-12]|nr:hypothetical protein [Thiomicrorhabdus sp. 6S3-12]MBO1924480.1 hypothetical protein [Thiomicrorhabdus sp. 6S3-12]